MIPVDLVIEFPLKYYPSTNTNNLINKFDLKEISMPSPTTEVTNTSSGPIGNTTIGNLVTGTSSSDVITTGGARDAVHAEGGDDVVRSGANQDRVYGQGGNDMIEGQGSNDKLYGGDGNDYLDGGGQDDRLYGGTGDDIIIGGDGNDVLYGDNAGDDNDMEGFADTFVFDANDGSDKVFDFEVGLDKVLLTDSTTYTLEYTKGGNTVMAYGDTIVTFYDSHLTASDITFGSVDTLMI